MPKGKRPVGGAASPTSPGRIVARERAGQAIELRKAGASFSQIATALGYANKSSAYRAVTDALNKIDLEPARELKILEAERLDRMQRSLWPDATQEIVVVKDRETGKEHRRVVAAAERARAVDSVLKIMERRAKLFGLDEPLQVENTVIDNSRGMTDEERQAIAALWTVADTVIDLID